jgi:hypothetical protein
LLQQLYVFSPVVWLAFIFKWLRSFLFSSHKISVARKQSDGKCLISHCFPSKETKGTKKSLTVSTIWQCDFNDIQAFYQQQTSSSFRMYICLNKVTTSLTLSVNITRVRDIRRKKYDLISVIWEARDNPKKLYDFFCYSFATNLTLFKCVTFYSQCEPHVLMLRLNFIINMSLFQVINLALWHFWLKEKYDC